MLRNNKFYIFLLLVITETIALLWLSFFPAVPAVRTGIFRLGDLEHLIAYAVYGFLLNRILSYNNKARKRQLLFAVILPFAIGSLVGGVCETIQLFVPTRVADVLDWGIDAFGSLAGATLTSKFKNQI